MPIHPAATPGRSERRAVATAISVGAAVLLLVSGCAIAATPGAATPGGSATTAVPTPTAGIGSSAASAAVPSAPSPSMPGQTETAWGRIWDDLPGGFPRFPGAATASIGRGPLSGEFTVAADQATVVATLPGALEAAGYRTVSVSNPLEDGSRTIESAGSATGCRVQTTVGPLGGLTAIAVLFGAACSFA